MPSLYERITQTHATRGPCPPGYFCQMIGELYRGKMTLSEASDYMQSTGGQGFDQMELDELGDLLETVDGYDRLQEIWDVLYITDSTGGPSRYNSAQGLRDRFGVPTRT